MIWEAIGLTVGTAMVFGSKNEEVLHAVKLKPQSGKKGKADKADTQYGVMGGATKPVQEATPLQALILVSYFFAVTWFNGGSPSFFAGIAYSLFAFFIVCLCAGSDSGNMSADFPWQFRVAAALRTPVLCFVVVPLSFALNKYRMIRTMYRGTNIDTEIQGHKDRVQIVVDQIAKWDKDGRKSKMRTARPNWAGMSTKLGSNKGDSCKIMTSHLDHIIEVDKEAMTITCEPSVNMGDITNLLLPQNLALLCQVEMESLTIGGLSMGLGMETNSHNAGWFQETVVQFEIVTAESPPQVRKVTAESDPELFYTLPHSVGTLGFLVSVTVKMTTTKPYMRMKYIMTKSAAELQDIMVKLSEADDDHKNTLNVSPKIPQGCATQFLEATAYSKDTAVIQTGEMCDAPTTAEDKAKINAINWWYKPFYFRWLETLLLQGHDTYEEIIPLKHYYHRFTRSIFWEIEDMIPFASHPLYRVFWGWLGAPEVSLLKLFQGPVIRRSSVYAHVVQESCMPVRRLEEGLDKFEQWWDIYPLLLFPLRTYDRKAADGSTLAGFLHPKECNYAPISRKQKIQWAMHVDLAAYGVPRSVREGGNFDAKKIVREFEHWTRDTGGFQCYYTDLFCTRGEYRQMFDHTLWDKCRARLNASDAFPEPFDKVRSEPGIVDLSEEEAAEEAAKKK